MRTNDGGAEATRQQAITRMANRVLAAAGIDPTPTQDQAPNSHTARAATFLRALEEELSVFESSTGRAATTREAHNIVDQLQEAATDRDWLKVDDPNKVQLDDMGSHLQPSSFSENPADTSWSIHADLASSADRTSSPSANERDVQWSDSNVVPVAGGNKNKDKDSGRPPLPGNRRPVLPADEMPPPKQLIPPSLPGGIGAPRPTPNTGGAAPVPKQPSTGVQEQGPSATKGDSSPKASTYKESSSSSNASNPKIALPEDESKTRHIFRSSPKGGHIADTAQNRQRLIDVANDQTALLGTDSYGNKWYGRRLPDGTQIWAEVRGNLIINGGLNQTEKTFNPLTGLSAPTVPQRP